MQKIFKTHEYAEAVGIKSLLETAGIPAYISDNGSRSRGPVIPEGFDVWIYIDTQKTDAEMLINNPQHEVSEAIDITAFYKDINGGEMQRYLQRYQWRFVTVGIAFIVVIILLIYYFFV